MLKVDAKTVTLPVKVEVFGFQLPTNGHYVAFSFGCSPATVARRYGGDSGQKIMERFAVEACSYRVHPAVLLNGWRWGGPKVRKARSGAYDFKPLDRWLDLFEQNRLTGFPMAIVPRFKKWGGGSYSEAFKARFADLLKAYAGHLKQKGLLEKAFVYNIDEAARSKGEWEICKEMYRLVKKTVPGVPVVQCLNEPRGVRALTGFADIWDLYYGQYERAGGPERLRAGDKIFLAVCIFPSVHPNIFIEYPLLDARILPWIGFRIRASGFEYWDMFQWGSNLGRKDWIAQGDGTRTAWELDKPHGNGLLMYPGPAGQPIPSLRLMALRDGLEDYEYLYLLQEKARSDRMAGALLKEATEGIVKGVTSYEPDPNRLLDLRERIGRYLSKK